MDDGSRRPFPLEDVGELILQMRTPPQAPDWELVVLQADPRVAIAVEILDEIRRAGHPFATLRGDILTINGSNQKVIYRIGDYMLYRDCYLAEWPD